jgi:hypothetical protein
MLDIESFLEAQNVMWVKRLVNSEEGSWTFGQNVGKRKLQMQHRYEQAVQLDATVLFTAIQNLGEVHARPRGRPF